MTRARCVLDKQRYTRANPRPRLCTHNQTHARKRTNPYARTQKYLIIIAVPQQQWFRKRASMLRYTYIACLVICYKQARSCSRHKCLLKITQAYSKNVTVMLINSCAEGSYILVCTTTFSVYRMHNVYKHLSKYLPQCPCHIQ
jgi:hypothetical protein